MRALVMSDSHGSTTVLEQLIRQMWQRYPEGFDAYIHLGDGARDFEELYAVMAQHDPKAKFAQVRGNCDWGSDLNDETALTLGGVRIFACHGHRYRVKYDLLLLEYAAAQRDCPVALFGHTHVQTDEAAGGVSLFNPGAACEGYIGVLEITGGAVVFHPYRLCV